MECQEPPTSRGCSDGGSCRPKDFPGPRTFCRLVLWQLSLTLLFPLGAPWLAWDSLVFLFGLWVGSLFPLGSLCVEVRVLSLCLEQVANPELVFTSASHFRPALHPPHPPWPILGWAKNPKMTKQAYRELAPYGTVFLKGSGRVEKKRERALGLELGKFPGRGVGAVCRSGSGLEGPGFPLLV